MTGNLMVMRLVSTLIFSFYNSYFQTLEASLCLLFMLAKCVYMLLIVAVGRKECFLV